MALVDVLNMNGEKVSEMTLSEAVFEVPVKPSVLHEVVTMQLASRRSGTASVKNRSDVSASGRKLYRQKGTGRARKGDRGSPLMRGGGSVFGPHPRSYAYKVPKKVRKQALRMALSVKLGDQKLTVVEHMDLETIKTKRFVGVLDALGMKNALIVTPGRLDHLELSARNVPRVKVLRSEGLNVYDILKYENLVLLQGAIEGIEGRLLA